LINDRDPTKRRLTVLSTSGLLSVIMLVIVAAVVISVIVPSISAALILPFSYAQSQNAATNSAACISYDSTDKIITISCSSASLTDINNQVKDANVIHKEEDNTAATTTGDNHNRRGGV
jgi:hypothetical protein